MTKICFRAQSFKDVIHTSYWNKNMKVTIQKKVYSPMLILKTDKGTLNLNVSLVMEKRSIFPRNNVYDSEPSSHIFSLIMAIST